MGPLRLDDETSLQSGLHKSYLRTPSKSKQYRGLPRVLTGWLGANSANIWHPRPGK